jgi:anti-sigma regulatory factor (Ser/Thr protein kinase)
MNARRSTRPATARGPLKSPLAVHSDHPATGFDAADRHPAAAVSDRAATIDEFDEYLRTTTNEEGRPYEEATISAYVCPAKRLDKWMTGQGIDGGFTTAGTKMLNRFFRDYYNERGQGGTHTLQRNLLQLFNFLEKEYRHPSPYTDGLNRYAEVKGRPKTLGAGFIDDLFEVTGGGKARDFVSARDHAIIRDVLLCLSELVTNAARHSRSGNQGGHFTILVRATDGEFVTVMVADDGGPWKAPDREREAPYGHGLDIVAALATEMGIDGDDACRLAWCTCLWTGA